jgi:hypothetical protein
LHSGCVVPETEAVTPAVFTIVAVFTEEQPLPSVTVTL